MSDATLIKQFEKLLTEKLTANNVLLKQTIREEIEVEINRLKSDGVRERLNMQVQLNKLTHDLKDLTIVVSKLERSLEKGMESMTDALHETRKELKAEIKASQDDTIEVLTATINSGYNLHNKRFLRLENKVGLPPIKR